MTLRLPTGPIVPTTQVMLLLFAFGGIAACEPSTSSSASPSPSATATAASSAGPTGCTLTSSLGGANSFAGHAVETIILTNTGTAGCLLNGYPTVQLLGPGGAVGSISEVQGGGQAAVATPSAVLVAVGARANFIVELADEPSGSGTCATVTSLAIQLPGSAGSVSQAFVNPLHPCGPTFHVGAISPRP